MCWGRGPIPSEASGSQSKGLVLDQVKGRGRTVEAKLLGMTSEALVVVPVAVDADRAELQHGVGAEPRPLHARALHSVPDPVLAATLDDTGGDGPASRKVQVVAHVGRVAGEVAHGVLDRFALLGVQMNVCVHGVAEVGTRLGAGRSFS